MKTRNCYTIKQLSELFGDNYNSPYQKALDWVREGFELEWILDDEYLIDPTPEEATLWKKRMLKAGISPLQIQKIFKTDPLFRYKVSGFSDLEYGSGNVGFKLTSYVPWEVVFAIIDLDPRVWKYANYDLVEDRSKTLIAVYCDCDLDTMTNYEKELCAKYLPSEESGELSIDPDSTLFLGQCDESLNDRMFTALRKAYKWMNSEEYVTEHSEANEYLFDENGKPVHHLIGVKFVPYKPKSKVSLKTLQNKIRKICKNDCLSIIGASQKDRKKDKTLASYHIGNGTFDTENKTDFFIPLTTFRNPQGIPYEFDTLTELEEWFKELQTNEEEFQRLCDFGYTFYIFIVRYSDGNDCSLTDFVVSAKSKQSAFNNLWGWYSEKYPNSEEDWSDPPCLWISDPCDCEDMCDCQRESITIPFDPESEHSSLKEAKRNCTSYHGYGELL